MPHHPGNDDRRFDEEQLLADSEAEPTDILPPTQVIGGKYRLGRLLGEGGMGSVYEAEHTGLGVKVAVKLLNEVFVSDPSAMSRFRREARAAAAIRHPNIVEVTDTGTDDEGVPFIVMELLQGENLSALLRREKVLPPIVAATITHQVLAGLVAAHDKNVIHRDLKPGNILLARQDDGSCQVKVLDFGISKFFAEGAMHDVTATGAVIGTPRFMAPEQARGQTDLDGRVDIYAVGVLMYRMLTGRLPFAARSHEEIIRHILEGKPKPPRQLRPDLSPELERVILTAMAPRREERYPDARAFTMDLQRVVPEVLGGTVQITTAPPGAITPTPLSLITSQGTASRLRLGGLTQDTFGASPHALRAQQQQQQQQQRSSWRLRVFLPMLMFFVGAAIVGGWFVWRHARQQGAGRTSEPVFTGPPVRFGITQYLPKWQLVKEHESIINYLSRRLRRPVKLVILEDYIDLSARLAAGDLELAGLTSYAYVRAKRRWPKLKLIATHVTTSGTSYEGYIISKASDTSIRSLRDLEGKVFCFVGPNSTSGYLYPRAILREQGVDPDKAFKATRFTGDHLSALAALDSGACQGAAVFGGMLFEGRQHGLPNDKFHILAATARIPYDAYCTPPSLSPALTRSLEEALLALKPGLRTTEQILGKGSRLIGFAPAQDSDWDSVRKIEKYLDTPEDLKQHTP